MRPEDFVDVTTIADYKANATAEVLAEVDVTEPLGSHIQMYLKLAGQQVIAMVDSKTHLKIGDKATFAVEMDKCHLFDKITEDAIF